MLVDQICAKSGGPCRYRGASMTKAHAGMKITDVEFDALVENLVASLNKFNVGPKEQEELLTLLGGMRGEIVGR